LRRVLDGQTTTRRVLLAFTLEVPFWERNLLVPREIMGEP
jgi:hypothetical protein